MGQKVQGSSFSSAARDAPELAVLQGLVAAKQRAAKLRSHSKATRSKAPEPQQSNAQQSSGACCVATKQRTAKLRSQASELVATQRAAKLWSLLRCDKATLQQSKQASKKMKKGSYLVVCAPTAPAPQP